MFRFTAVFDIDSLNVHYLFYGSIAYKLSSFLAASTIPLCILTEQTFWLSTDAPIYVFLLIFSMLLVAVAAVMAVVVKEKHSVYRE